MTATFWDQVQKLAEEAPEAGYANVNFGKLTAIPVVINWTTDGDGVRKPERKPLKDGAALAEGESLEIQFKVEISELNPNLEFDYERSVPVRKSGRVKTDWSEIVLPSLEYVFGKDWGKAIIGKNPYVLVEDAANIAGKASATGRVYGVPKFLQVFKSKAECQAARDIRFAKHDAATPVPAEEGAVETDGPVVDDAVIKQVKSLVDSVGEKKAAKMLESRPFGDFDPEFLLGLLKTE